MSCKHLPFVIAVVIALGLAWKSWGGSVSYNSGTFTGNTSVSGDNFTIPLWDPAAHPGEQMYEAELSLQLTVSANVNFVYTSDVLPTGSADDLITPQYFWGNPLGDFFNGPDSYTLAQANSPMNNVALQTGTGSFPLFGWGNGSQVAVTGTGTLLFSADLPSVTIRNAGGMADGVISGVNSATVTETATQTYFYNNVPEPVSAGLLLGGLVVALSHRPRRR